MSNFNFQRTYILLGINSGTKAKNEKKFILKEILAILWNIIGCVLSRHNKSFFVALQKVIYNHAIDSLQTIDRNLFPMIYILK